MIDEPVPTMPLMVPATSPTARTKRKFKVLFPANRKHRRWSQRVGAKRRPMTGSAKSGNERGTAPDCAALHPGYGLNDRYSRNTLTCHTRESGRFTTPRAHRAARAKSFPDYGGVIARSTCDEAIHLAA